MKHIVLFFALLISCSAFGEQPEHPLLPADTSSPRATLNSFMENCTIAYDLLKAGGRDTQNETTLAEAHAAVRHILRCMDISQIAEFRQDSFAKESAVMLKEVLDRIELPKEKAIPDLKMMTNEDGSLAEKWTIPNTEITFQLIKEGRYKGTYQFSSYTIEHADAYYKRVQHLAYKEGATPNFAGIYLTSPGREWLVKLVHQLPPSMNLRKNGLAVWQWVGTGVVLLGGLMIMTLIYYIGRRVSRHGPEGGLLRYVLGLAFPIMAVFIPIKAQFILSNILVLSGTTLYVIKFNLSLITLFAAMIVVLGIGKRIGDVISSAPHIAAHSIDAQLVRMMSRMLGFAAAMILLLQGGQHLGIPLSSLLAGAGVIGMALALSAQDVLKNVFGSIMLVMDKPFTVGERIKIKHYDGVVEEIGLRSTKIRLLDGHQASIPNEEMAKTDIENIGRRPFIRRVSEIPLSTAISSDKAKQAVELVQEILKDHEGSDPDFPPRVWLNEFERDHLELKMIYWYHPPDYWAYTTHADLVNRQILDAFEKAEIKISLPAFTTRVEDQFGV